MSLSVRLNLIPLKILITIRDGLCLPWRLSETDHNIHLERQFHPGWESIWLVGRDRRRCQRGWCDDIIVGARVQQRPSQRAAFVYFGFDKKGLSATANWTVESDQENAGLGWSVATAGDKRDGFAEVIVGAPWHRNGQTDQGAAFVYHGSASGLSSTFNWSSESNQEYSYFGYSVATAGDVNKDGYSDVLIGAPWYDTEENNESGAAFLPRRTRDGSFYLIPILGLSAFGIFSQSEIL